MKTENLRRFIIIFLIASILSSNAIVFLPKSTPQPAQASGPGPNLVLGFFRAIAALNKRNRVYTEAGATAGEINSYYDGLIEKTREIRQEMISNAVTGETSPVLVRSYVRMEAALEAERKAAIEIIEAEKNQARIDFNRDLVREITTILTASPGGQKILNDVRHTIASVRDAAVAVQLAANEGKPIDLLANTLADEVGNIQIVKNAAYELGSTVGSKLDQALGGVFGSMQQAMNNVQEEMQDAIGLLDELDTVVAQYHDQNQNPLSMIEDENQINKVSPVDRTNAVIDVVAYAYAGAAEISGGQSGGKTRETMRDRVRDALLNQRLEGIKDISTENNQGKIYCTAVGRGEYEVATGKLGKNPETPSDPENVVYMVCYQLGTQTPVYTSMTEPKDDNDQQPTETPDQINQEIPAGEYQGYSDYDEYLGQLFYGNGGILAENKVQIKVAENGVVTGSLEILYIGNDEIYDDCTSRWDIEIMGEFQGRLTENYGMIEITENWTNSFFSTCEENYAYDSPFPRQIEVEVIDGQMVGSAVPVEDSDPDLAWTFTAERGQ